MGEAMKNVHTTLTVVVLAAVATVANALAQSAPATPPPADELIRKACDAAGGLDAFRALGIVHLTLDRSEVAKDGTETKDQISFFFRAPGPIPARLENVERKVVAGDDGTGGWAINGGAVDKRAMTKFMVERVIRTDLFQLLLPFSLTWEGVTVRNVAADTVDGTPAWRLDMAFPANFFFTPQISSNWRIYLHRDRATVLRAESDPTDLGGDMKADGMLITWAKPVKLGEVWLFSEMVTLGRNLKGEILPHTRRDTMSYRLLPLTEAPKLFPNPIPPDKRPKPYKLEPPAQPVPPPGE
jgi:hypothetical protein